MLPFSIRFISIAGVSAICAAGCKSGVGGGPHMADVGVDVIVSDASDASIGIDASDASIGIDASTYLPSLIRQDEMWSYVRTLVGSKYQCTLSSLIDPGIFPPLKYESCGVGCLHASIRDLLPGEGLEPSPLSFVSARIGSLSIPFATLSYMWRPQNLLHATVAIVRGVRLDTGATVFVYMNTSEGDNPVGAFFASPDNVYMQYGCYDVFSDGYLDSERSQTVWSDHARGVQYPYDSFIGVRLSPLEFVFYDPDDGTLWRRSFHGDDGALVKQESKWTLAFDTNGDTMIWSRFPDDVNDNSTTDLWRMDGSGAKRLVAKIPTRACTPKISWDKIIGVSGAVGGDCYQFMPEYRLWIADASGVREGPIFSDEAIGPSALATDGVYAAIRWNTPMAQSQRVVIVRLADWSARYLDSQAAYIDLAPFTIADGKLYVGVFKGGAIHDVYVYSLDHFESIGQPWLFPR